MHTHAHTYDGSHGKRRAAPRALRQPAACAGPRGRHARDTGPRGRDARVLGATPEYKHSRGPRVEEFGGFPLSKGSFAP